MVGPPRRTSSSRWGRSCATASTPGLVWVRYLLNAVDVSDPGGRVPLYRAVEVNPEEGLRVEGLRYLRQKQYATDLARRPQNPAKYSEDAVVGVPSRAPPWNGL